MRTDHPILAGLLRPLHGCVERNTAHADHQARAAGLTVAAGPGGVRRYRDPRLDQLATRRAAHLVASGLYADVRAAATATPTTAWSTPTLTVSASPAEAGWSR
jgi:hypothetical protein